MKRYVEDPNEQLQSLATEMVSNVLIKRCPRERLPGSHTNYSHKSENQKLIAVRIATRGDYKENPRPLPFPN